MVFQVIRAQAVPLSLVELSCSTASVWVCELDERQATHLSIDQTLTIPLSEQMARAVRIPECAATSGIEVAARVADAQALESLAAEQRERGAAAE